MNAKDYYKEYESIVDEKLKDKFLSYDPIWYSLRFAGDTFYKKYGEEKMVEIIKGIEKLPDGIYRNKMFFVSTMKSAIAMRHMVRVDADGTKTPMEYKPLV